MVRLFRGTRGRGVPMNRPPPPIMHRGMAPPFGYEEFTPDYALQRPRLLRRPIGRPGPLPPLGTHGPHIPPTLPPPRMVPPHLPPQNPRNRPLPPPHPSVLPRVGPGPIPVSGRPHPMPIRGHHPGMLPPRPPMLPGGPPHGTIPSLFRGRGRQRDNVGFLRRGVKRLGFAINGHGKSSTPKRRGKNEDAFFCEMCDRGFKTQEKLAEHVSQHEVCGRDGCTFTAHPKIILKHVQIQHDTGLYKRIMFTQNPDEVAKWIAERKSRYPTKDNVARKEAQQEEMIKRGERIASQGRPFANKERSRNWKDRRQRRKNKVNISDVPKQEKQLPNSKNKFNTSSNGTKWRDPDAWRGDLPQFPGTAAFPSTEETDDKDIKENGHFSDDEWSDKKIDHDVKITSTPGLSNILSTLAANYGSDMTDDDNDDDINNETHPQIMTTAVCNIKNEIINTETEKPAKHCEEQISNNNKSPHNMEINCGYKGPESSHIVNDSDSGPEECEVHREDKLNIPIPAPKQEPKKKTSEIQNLPNHGTTRPSITRPVMKKYQLSLLEKLLKNEIHKERNIILQCVRYVVQNNFLGSGTT